MAAGIIRVGISGWTYAPWRGVFYPKGLKREHELAYASEQFPSIEINGTFYGLQRSSSFTSWTHQVPPHFVFAVKAPRFLTHIRRLRDVEVPLANFIASGLLCLDHHLGPILWQLPPNFRFDPEQMEQFLRLLPHDTEAAAELGRKYDAALRAPAALPAGPKRPLRHALEVRHESFLTADFIALLRTHRVALVCSDAPAWPRLMDVTADFIYCRLHGSKELYASGYDDATLDEWADRITRWARGGNVPPSSRIAEPANRRRRDVFVYFDNDLKVAAPGNALALIRRLRA